LGRALAFVRGLSLKASSCFVSRSNCDSGRIAQLFSNLLGNALSHGSAASPVRVQAATRDGAFELSAANSGDPIPPGAMERLFQPFYRAAVRRSLGLGLGFIWPPRSPAAHGGTLGVDSAPNETRVQVSDAN
jgi:sigma-B regulation protein RsbU (phosphoserine phosphatase)